jgi:hypothetical protein
LACWHVVLEYEEAPPRRAQGGHGDICCQAYVSTPLMLVVPARKPLSVGWTRRHPPFVLGPPHKPYALRSMCHKPNNKSPRVGLNQVCHPCAVVPHPLSSVLWGVCSVGSAPSRVYAAASCRHPRLRWRWVRVVESLGVEGWVWVLHVVPTVQEGHRSSSRDAKGANLQPVQCAVKDLQRPGAGKKVTTCCIVARARDHARHRLAQRQVVARPTGNMYVWHSSSPSSRTLSAS